MAALTKSKRAGCIGSDKGAAHEISAMTIRITKERVEYKHYFVRSREQEHKLQLVDC